MLVQDAHLAKASMPGIRRTTRNPCAFQNVELWPARLQEKIVPFFAQRDSKQTIDSEEETWGRRQRFWQQLVTRKIANNGNHHVSGHRVDGGFQAFRGFCDDSVHLAACAPRTRKRPPRLSSTVYPSTISTNRGNQVANVDDNGANQ